ncbi:hypothetical protein ACFT7U_11935 [Streptomyces rochei]|nr:hypothetical protein [Streptomyces rochei]NEC72963.1 hypothetical protein [Streptomyces rochei]
MGEVVCPQCGARWVVGVGRTVAGDIRKEAQELLAGGYGPITAYVPQGDR